MASIGESESESESEVVQWCPTFRNLMDCSPPGSAVPGIVQARVLEWGAIAFSDWVHNFIKFVQQVYLSIVTGNKIAMKILRKLF